MNSDEHKLLAQDIRKENESLRTRIAELEGAVKNLITGLEEARHNMPTSRLHAIDSITEALSHVPSPTKDPEKKS